MADPALVFVIGTSGSASFQLPALQKAICKRMHNNSIGIRFKQPQGMVESFQVSKHSLALESLKVPTH